jgi:lipopolysaccharide export system permease protein
MQFLWRYIDDLVGKGLELRVIGELLLYTSSSLVPMALPLSILMSSLMTFGNMGEFYELTAIKASGISLQRIMIPLVMLVIAISIGAFFFANDVLPYTNLKMRSLLYDVRNQRPEISIMPGAFYNGIDGYSMRIDRKDPNTNMMYNIKIYDHTQAAGNTSITIADSGKMIVTRDERNLIFTLYNGHSYIELENERKPKRVKTYPHRYDKFEEQQFIIELVGFNLTRTDENLFKDHYSMLNLDQLELMKDSIKTDIGERQTALNSTLVNGNYFRSRNRSRNTHEEPAATKSDSVLKVTRAKIIEKTMEHSRPVQPIAKPEPVKEDQGKIVNNDTAFYEDIMARLTMKELDLIYESALSFARSARTYVDGSAQTIDTKIRRLRRFEIEWQRKFTIAVACFLFLLIGAPLGAIVRKGGLGLPLVLSTFLFIFYYILSLFGEKVVRESIVPAWQGMWMASAIFFTVGVFLTYKATTDAAILNFETYSNFLKKFQSKRTLTDTLKEDFPVIEKKDIKPETLVSSLMSLMESANQLIIKINNQFTWADFTLSLLALHGDSDILMFGRLYKNTGKSMMGSRQMETQSIRLKFNELPEFKAKTNTYFELKIVVKFIMLAIPPLAIIVAVKHAITLNQMRSRLKLICSLTEELIHQIRINN